MSVPVVDEDEISIDQCDISSSSSDLFDCNPSVIISDEESGSSILSQTLFSEEEDSENDFSVLRRKIRNYYQTL